MGRGGKRGGGRGRGGRGGGGSRTDTRVDKHSIPRRNDKFERYYNELELVPETEREAFWDAMRRDLPNSFRFTGSKSHALAVQERLRSFYIPEIKAIQYEGEYVEPPQPVDWYPDQLAWYMTTPKHIVRRFKPFASFQRFLVAETDVGNITRQEVVSMIPPLVMDLKPGMTVLDLCAAPGSKSAQLLEMIHSGEEDRSRQVASRFADGLDKPEGEDFADDGRSTGLLIANDVDYRRAHMLVHQMKRLASPNIIVTNHDATIFPSIKLPSVQDSQNRYLKFDRILADVPCSGDGTPRKNIEIWKNWIPSNSLGLYMTQVRILVRALQMLKVGGRVVYSTCSMNPVEDEAVLATAINRCGGSDVVELIETKDLLPGLRRSEGLKKWSIMDKTGRMWPNWKSVSRHRDENGEDGLSRLQEGMFPPTNDIPLDRAMRIYPHFHDTGAFFIAILEKRGEIRAQPEDKSAIIPAPPKTERYVKPEAADSNGILPRVSTAPNGDIPEAADSEPSVPTIANDASVNDLKRKIDEEHSSESKRIKVDSEAPQHGHIQEDDDTRSANITTPQTEVPKPTNTNGNQYKKKNREQPHEEPFKYLDPSVPELQQITEFYQLSSRFPMTRFMVRNAQSTASKNIYYTSQLAKDILTENEGKGMKFVHCGVKMFVKQDAPSPDVCSWRIQTDGLRILETWVGSNRTVRLTQKETLRKLLIEMFPRFHGDDWKNLGEIGPQVRDMSMGCCVLIVEPTESEGGFSERMVFPLWKSIQSLNLMLPKEERKAMLLRLFNDDTELVNPMGKGKKQQQEGTQVELKVEESKDGDDDGDEEIADQDTVVGDADDETTRERRNSSSPEPETKTEEIVVASGALHPEDAPKAEAMLSEDEEDGGARVKSPPSV